MPKTRRHVDAPAADWPLTLPTDLPETEVAALRGRAEELAEKAQYGWGHTIDFGAFTMPGLLGEKYLTLAGVVDRLGWWPKDLTGAAVADVGCFTGGLTALLAARGAAEVTAVDELPEHLEQCEMVAGAFGLDAVETEHASLYQLVDRLGEDRYDVILCAGVLYHLSDMLVGLIELQRLLKPGGVVVLESNAIENYEHSYANYGRFVGGMWWQPTALCIQDMAEHAGFERPEVVFYQPGRALARLVKPTDPARAELPFTRGINLDVPDRRDRTERTLDVGQLAPAPDISAEAGMVAAGVRRVLLRLLRLPMQLGYRYRVATRKARKARDRG